MDIMIYKVKAAIINRCQDYLGSVVFKLLYCFGIDVIAPGMAW